MIRHMQCVHVVLKLIIWRLVGGQKRSVMVVIVSALQFEQIEDTPSYVPLLSSQDPGRQDPGPGNAVPDMHHPNGHSMSYVSEHVTHDLQRQQEIEQQVALLQKDESKIQQRLKHLQNQILENKRQLQPQTIHSVHPALGYVEQPNPQASGTGRLQAANAVAHEFAAQGRKAFRSVTHRGKPGQ